ncbi:MAG: FoF1 ATP synthase subunit gamma, partial [bacterium]
LQHQPLARGRKPCGRRPRRKVIYAAGRKARDYFRRRKWNIAREFVNISFHLEYREIKNIVDAAAGDFLAGRADEILIAYHRYVKAQISRIEIVPLLPLAPPKTEAAHARVKYIFQPTVHEVVDVFYPKYLHTKVTLALAEAMASEQGQRMVAMTNATDNAGEMIDYLTLHFNKARQAAITKEILEVVSGAEALKSR